MLKINGLPVKGGGFLPWKRLPDTGRGPEATFSMRLEELLTRDKKEITEAWFDTLVSSYPTETMVVLKSRQDPFANPVGATARRGLEAVYEELVGAMDTKTVITVLDPLIRIRAVQTLFTASQAVAFIFELKLIVRRQFMTELSDTQIREALPVFESKIDKLALMAFDIFMACREKLADIKANELKDRTLHAFERAGLVATDP